MVMLYESFFDVETMALFVLGQPTMKDLVCRERLSCCSTLEGRTAPTSALVLLKEGRRILSPSFDSTVRIWSKSELTGQHLAQGTAPAQVIVGACTP